MGSDKKVISSTPQGVSIASQSERDKVRVRSSASKDAARLSDSFNTNLHLKTPSDLSQKERENTIAFISKIHPGAGLMGVLESQWGHLPVAFASGYRDPMILRALPHLYTIESEEKINRLFSLASKVTPLETYSLRYDADGIPVLERTFVPLVLEDVLRSSKGVSLKSVLDTLIRVFYEVERLHTMNLIHGHIAPGNICFRGEFDGCLLDIGVAIRSQLASSEFQEIAGKDTNELDDSLAPEIRERRSLKEISAAVDSYGLGITLKRVLSEIVFLKSEASPSREALMSSLTPLISALTNQIPEKRPRVELGRLMLLDLLPMIYPGYVAPDLTLNDIVESELPVEDLEPNGISSVSETSGDSSVQTSDEEEIGEHNSLSEHEDDDFFSFKDARRDQPDRANAGQADLEHTKVDSSSDREADFGSDSLTSYKGRARTSSLSATRFVVYFLLFSTILLTLYFSRERIRGLFSGNMSLTGAEYPFSVSSNYDAPDLGVDELRAAWASQVPSSMKIVAKAAVYSSPKREIAEQIILASLRLDNISPQLVDSEFLRIAFFHKWEDTLDETDRRYALSLGLLKVLENTAPPDLGLLEERHPAVLLAVLSTGNTRVQNTLRDVPVSVLTSLPTPYGTAFKILTAGKSDVTCSAPEVVSLARFSTRGIERPIDISQFLREDFSRRISSLSVAYSQNNDHARKLLDIIIEHPNFSLKTPEVLWAKKVELLSWSEIEAVDQLFLLAGVALRPEKILTAPSIAKLFLNPAPRVRGYAAALAVDAISFKHPAAPDILMMIQKSPEIISADQLVMLGQILEDPEKTIDVHRKIVHGFIASKPPAEIARLLLIGTAKAAKSTPLDSALAIYLSETGWNPDAADLLSLSAHPDGSTRMFAYQKIFQFGDREHASLLLKEALKRESISDFKEQLVSLIKQLENRNSK